MGLGITLGANGLLGELGGGGDSGNSGSSSGGGGDGNGSGRSRGWQGETIEMTGGAEASLAPPVVKVGVRVHLLYVVSSFVKTTPPVKDDSCRADVSWRQRRCLRKRRQRRGKQCMF